MDFKKLRTFQCAAVTLNFSEAANRLGYVQSAVTNQIKALEDELATTLFDRNGRGVALTESGEQLFYYTQKLMSLRDEATLVVSNFQNIRPISIGGNDTIITYYLPKLLNQFRLTAKDTRFSVQQIPVANLKSDVLAGNLDVAFVLEKPFQKPHLKVHTYQTEDVVIVSSPVHRFSARQQINPSELVDEHILLTEKGCCYRHQFERVLISAGIFDASKTSEFVSIEAIKECVKLGVGIAALSLSSVKQEVRRGELHILNIAHAEMASHIHCVYHDKRVYPSYIRDFLQFSETFCFQP